MTPGMAELRRGAVIGTGQWISFTLDATDEQVRELCATAYGWNDVVIVRDAAIVKARPRAIENLRKPHPNQKQIDTVSVETLLGRKPAPEPHPRRRLNR